MKRALQIVGVVLSAATLVIILVSTWWWALLGLPENVGLAWAITGLLTGSGAFTSLMWSTVR